MRNFHWSRVIGPPLAFMLALNYGFTAMFTIAAGLFVISTPVLIAFWLPSVARIAQPADVAVTQVGGWRDKNVRMLFIASTLMWTCNTMYIIDMPLWISLELGLPDKLAGDPDGDGCRAGDPGDDPRPVMWSNAWASGA